MNTDLLHLVFCLTKDTVKNCVNTPNTFCVSYIYSISHEKIGMWCTIRYDTHLDLVPIN